MRNAYDIFMLMFNLSQLNNRERVIKLFTKEMNRIFHPATFTFSETYPKGKGDLLEIKTSESVYGYFQATDILTQPSEYKKLLVTAVQMLAMIFENLELNKKLREERDSYQKIAIQKMDELQATVKNLVKARSASINLIEDLSEQIEKRINTEKELRKSEEKYRTLFETNRDGILIFESVGGISEFTILEYNQGIKDIFGYDPSQSKHVNIFDFELDITPEILKKRLEILKKKGILEFDARFIHQKGFPVDVNIKAILITYSGKQAVYNIIREITEKKQMERLMKSRLELMEYAEHHSLQELLMETLRLAEDLTESEIGFYHFIDEEKGLILLNQWSEKTLEKYCNVAKPFEKHYPIEKAGIWVDCIRERKPVIHNNYNEVKNKKGMPEGHAILTRELVVPVLRNNTIMAILGIGNKPSDYNAADISIITQLADMAWDIAERKLSQEKLRESEDKLRLIFENAPLGVLHFDKNGIITQCNDSFVQIIGSSQKALVGLNMLALPDKNMVGSIKEALEGKSIVYEGVYHSVTANKITPIRFLFNPIAGENGKVEGGIGILEDRSSHVQREEYRKQVEIERESVKFKQNFLANMSHEIRTPLTGVLGMLEILEQTPLSEKQKDYLQTLKQSGENLQEIINQVLDFSKIEAGKVNLKHCSFQFSTITDNASRLFMGIRRPNVEFVVDHDKAIPKYVTADKNRISQVVNNLVSNALKFTSKGSITLCTRLLQHEKTTGNIIIKIEVKDTGIGIPKKLHSKLFVPFGQIDAVDTRMHEGTGLGLSICKELVILHGGEIGLESKYGEGSTFWFTFAAKAAQAQEEAIKQATKNKNIGKLRILFAEDKIVNQKVVKLMLQSQGHEVSLANNGQDVLSIYEEDKFDLILMDIQMPLMDGISATRLLRDRYQNLPPIVGLSANAFEGDREKYMALGMDDYITKPVKKEDFQDLIARVFGDTNLQNQI